MAETYTSKYATGAAVDAALDKAGTALQPGLNHYFAKANPAAVAFSVLTASAAQTNQALQVEVNGLIRLVAASTAIAMPDSLVAGTDYAIWCATD
jgi:hypothetical protein